MSATFGNSSQFSNSSQSWSQIGRISLRPAAEPARLRSSFWDDLVSLASLLTLVATIAYLVLR